MMDFHAQTPGAAASRPSAARQARLCAERLKVLGEPTRLRILDELQAGPRTPEELRRRIGIAANLLSHHLKILRLSGFVEPRRNKAGRLYYHLHAGVFRRDGTAAVVDLGCCRVTFS